jgi:hypothetical protein
VIVIALLLLLLLTRELIGVYGTIEAKWRVRALSIVIHPLVLAFGVIMLMRLWALLA